MIRLIEKIWKLNPDLRLSQLILNVRPSYYTEDKELKAILEAYYGVSA